MEFLEDLLIHQGPALFYVDSDGSRLKGDLFSVGSGSTFAYGVLDQVSCADDTLLHLRAPADQQGYSYDLSDEEAQELGRRSIIAAGHRDAFSGNTCNLFHVRENGWEFIGMSLVCTLWRMRLTK
jgi:20S proteasome subunit beta 5